VENKVFISGFSFREGPSRAADTERKGGRRLALSGETNE